MVVHRCDADSFLLPPLRLFNIPRCFRVEILRDVTQCPRCARTDLLKLVRTITKRLSLSFLRLSSVITAVNSTRI